MVPTVVRKRRVPPGSGKPQHREEDGDSTSPGWEWKETEAERGENQRRQGLPGGSETFLGPHCVWGERERERDGEREKERERERERERQWW